MDPQEFHRRSGDVDARIAAALAKLALAGRRALDRRAGAKSLSAIQALVLERLARLGPLQVGALAAQLAITPPTVSDSVAALERKGLVVREPVAEDGRGVAVRLTPEGRRVARGQVGWTEIFQSAVEKLTPEEKKVLLRLLLRLIAELVERGVVRDARMCVTCEHFRLNAHPGDDRPHHCGLVDLPLSDEHLRVDCNDQVAVAPSALKIRLRVLQGGVE